MLRRSAAVLAFYAVLALSSGAWAQATPDLVGDIAKAAAAPVPATSSRMLKQEMQDWIDTSDFATRPELTIVQGRAVVSVPPTNPEWVRRRMLAYAQAVLAAQADFAISQGVDILDNAVKDVVTGPDAPPPYQDLRSASQAAEVARKFLALAGGTLDQKLQGMGIDPKKYEQAPEGQRTELLRDHFKKEIVRGAHARLAGLVPVKSFEGQDGKGNYSVGVVMIWSKVMQDFAEQVIQAHGQFTPDPARAQDLTTLYKAPDQLLQDFGVRRMLDKQGLPVIVSFAQWGSKYRGTDPVFAAKYEEAAEAQAESLADAQIADFLAAVVSVNGTANVGENVDQIALSLPDDWKPEEIKKIIDESNRQITSSSHIRVVGIHTLHGWTGKHPDSETPIVGVIRIWSAATEQSMRAVGVSSKPKPAASEGQIDRAPAVTQSRTLMNANDF